MSQSRVQAQAGPRLGTEGRRPHRGRIAGIERSLAPLAPFRGRGVESEVPSDLAVDWDCCYLGDEPIRDLQGWRAVLEAGRLAEVEGAFALAWRGPHGLMLARDALGERSLYYAPLPDSLVYASHVKVVLASGLVPRRLSLPALVSYLCCAYVPGRRTLAEGVFELLPGEMLLWRNGQVSRSFFWSVPEEPPAFASEEDLQAQLRATLERAVRRRLPTGLPVGATLSGGVDSSLVVALTRQLHNGPIHTYSISFGKEYANELPFSSLVAEHCRTLHTIVELSPRVVLHHLDDSIALLSDPIGDPLTVPNAILFREAAREVEVVLNGEGGDPCFGGPKNLPMLLSEIYGAGEQQDRPRNYLRSHLKCYDDLPAMLTDRVNDSLREEPAEAWLLPYFEDRRWSRYVTRLQAMNIILKGGHHILPKVDALSAPQGVLPRSPLFDRALVALSMAIPPQLKLRGTVEKYLLKRAVADVLPRAILDRPKSGMLVPVEGWFQGPLQAAARERLLDGLGGWDLIRRDYLERLLSGQLGGLRPRHGVKTWLLVTLEAWLRTVLQKGEPGA